MKSVRKRIAALLLTAAFLLTGCGEALYEMSPEEEAAVISYASHVVAKYNTYQQDGEIFVRKDLLDEEDTQEAEPPQEETEEPEETQTPEDTQETEGQDLNKPSEDTETEHTAAMDEALQLGAVKADFKESSLCTAYEVSETHAVDALPGQQLLVLKFQLTNSGSQDVHLDVLAMKPIFRAAINETETAVAQTTILPNDLSTYQGDLLAGSSAEVVLLFQISQDIAEITDLRLEVTSGDETYTVNL